MQITNQIRTAKRLTETVQFDWRSVAIVGVRFEECPF